MLRLSQERDKDKLLVAQLQAGTTDFKDPSELPLLLDKDTDVRGHFKLFTSTVRSHAKHMITAPAEMLRLYRRCLKNSSIRLMAYDTKIPFS